MKRNSGILLIVLLLAALLVLFLAAKQMDAFGLGGSRQAQAEPTADVVQQAQDAVDAINQRMQEAGETP
jgi:hypothetical protein